MLDLNRICFLSSAKRGSKLSISWVKETAAFLFEMQKWQRHHFMVETKESYTFYAVCAAIALIAIFRYIRRLRRAVGVYAMAPLDTCAMMQDESGLNRLKRWLKYMKKSSVRGIMIDVWWGLTESQPGKYDFDIYERIFDLIASYNLKIIPVLSFHKCGGNPGDNVNIDLPKFIVNAANSPFFTDSDGHIDNEYISLGYDHVEVEGRTPIQMYKQYMGAFKHRFESMIKSKLIFEIEVGLGPCGELRYPGYQLQFWKYPGIGSFQAYDPEMIQLLEEAAAAEGHPEFGHNPENAGTYNTDPTETTFWTEQWKTAYGTFYLKWYASALIHHGREILRVARQIFGPNVRLSGKISGIHWGRNYEFRPAEATTGYNCCGGSDGYGDIARMFKEFNVNVCFTCLEKTPEGDYSNPPQLVKEVAKATKDSGLEFEGENAMECFDKHSYRRIENWKKYNLKIFTYLRLGADLVEYDHFRKFKRFVRSMDP